MRWLDRFALAGLVTVVACATSRDRLAQGQRAFDANDPAGAGVVLRDLEPDLGRLAPADRARYAYVRGMASYRVGDRADARHWLLLGRAYEQAAPGTLPADWKRRTDDALAELDAIATKDGHGALLATPTPAR